MKNRIILGLAMIICCLCSSCRAHYPVAQESGQQDIAYLLFVSQEGQYAKQTVSVQLDDTRFDAQPVVQKKANRRGTQYTVTPGRRKLTVKDQQGKVLYTKEVMLSAQETKQIMLP